VTLKQRKYHMTNTDVQMRSNDYRGYEFFLSARDAVESLGKIERMGRGLVEVDIIEEDAAKFFIKTLFEGVKRLCQACSADLLDTDGICDRITEMQYRDNNPWPF
jgi:hypothetical protein